MRRSRTQFAFLNLGHFLDHYLMLIFASVAALTLVDEWGITYAEIIPYATPGFIAFGACALAAGWIADRWSRQGMMVIFFIGAGGSALFSAMADNPLQMATGLLLIGIFAAIYHPVGLAMVVEGRNKTGAPLAVNGVFGNMGVACAALVTGLLIDSLGWRSAFFLPGCLSIAIGLLYLGFIRSAPGSSQAIATPGKPAKADAKGPARAVFVRVFAIIFFTTAIGGLVFQSTTFSLPRVFAETLEGPATVVGGYAFLVFSVAAMAQLAVGYLLDNYSLRSVFSVVAAMQAILFAAMTQTDGSGALLIAVGFMLFVFGQIPINDVLVARLVRSEWRSRAYAIRYIVTFSVMALAVPAIAWIHGNWGFDLLFTVLAVAAAMIFVATLMLPANSREITHAAST